MRGKRVVMTGAAGGIGAAGARHLASLGATVVGFDVADEQGEAVFGGLGAPHAYRHVDITDPEGLTSALREACRHLGGIDLLWLNAGVLTRGRGEPMDDPVRTLDHGAYRRAFDVNVGANVVAIGAAVPLMEETGGDIVVTASAAGLVPFPPDPVYTATKHAMVGLVRSLGPVLARRGVRVHAVCPGGTDTPMAAGAEGAAAAAEAREHLQPPVRVAEAVVELLEAGATGDAWTVLPGRPPVRITFPELRSRGFSLP